MSTNHIMEWSNEITTIGLDVAKNVFQVHGIDAAEKVVLRKQLRRSQVLAFCGRIWRGLGIVAAQGREGVKELLKIIATEQDARMPVDAHTSLVVLAAGLQALQTMIRSIERRIIAQHRSDEASKRLRSIPGVGGMRPQWSPPSRAQRSFDRVERARYQPEKYPWVTRLLERRPFRVVAVAVANKMARVAWTFLARGGSIGRLRLRQRRKESGDSRASLRLCAYGLQGDDDVDAKRSRPSIGKTREGPRNT